MRTFSFRGDVAKLVGSDAATIYQNIKYWCEKNAANKTHERDGRHWTYNSAEAFKEIFWHLSESQIRRALKKLEAENLIISETFGDNPFDRTKWYSFNDLAPSDEIVKSSQRNRHISSDEIVNCTSDEIVKCNRTDINTDIKPDINTPSGSPAKKPTPKKSRLPDEGWIPSEEQHAFAVSQGMTDENIQEEANDFHIYWTERTDRGASKTKRGWDQTWRNRIKDVAWKYLRRNRGMAGASNTSGYGQGSSIASIVAQRRIDREV